MKNIIHSFVLILKSLLKNLLRVVLFILFFPAAILAFPYLLVVFLIGIMDDAEIGFSFGEDL